jgi:uncharacterized membrane protein YfcA
MFTAELILFVVWASLLCEFIDSSLGGGYGTILTPLFLLFAIPKTLIVIAILISETITGITGPICHHGLGNTKFNRSEEGIENFKVLILIGGLGTIAVIISVYTDAILDTM